MNFFSQYAQRASELLNVDANDLVEKARAAAKEAADAANNFSETVQAEYRRTFVELDCEIYGVSEDLFVMEFPDEEKINRLSTRLNNDYPQRMLIYNMSERRYDYTKFLGEVVDVAFRGLPAPPLELVFELCLSAHRWLASDPGNVLVVHCFQNFSRSAVFLSCFLAFRGLYSHPVDALHDVCRKLRVDDAATIIPTQRRYLAYFDQVQQGSSPMQARLNLLTVRLLEVPNFETEGPEILRPYVEVWNHGSLVHSSFPSWQQRTRVDADGVDGAGSAPTTLPPAVAADEPSVCFQMPVDIVISGDVLVRIRHVYLNGNRDTVCRFAFHTGLVLEDQPFRLAKHELDGACDDARFPKDGYIEVIFTREEPSIALDVPLVFSKARETSEMLRVEEAARLRRAMEKEQEEKQRRDDSGKQPPRDEEEELEATLLRGSGGGMSTSAHAASNARASDAAELRRALAEAAAEEQQANPGAAAQKATHVYAASPNTAVATGGYSSSSTSLNAVKPGTEANGSGSVVAVVSPEDEIDALFGEFDAALVSAGATAGATASLTAKAGNEVPGQIVSVEVQPDDKLASDLVARPSNTTSQSKNKPAEADIFADVDDFLKELEGAH